MSPSAPPRSTLRARRIRQRVMVARSHPDPERVRLRMHGALSVHLPDALAAAFPQSDASDEDVVWCIRHLALDLAVNARWDERRLAREWAARLARAVRRAIAGGPDGVNVVRFAGRAPFLAAFVREVADGTAWTRWWYGRFDGLKLLTRSATIRTALVREPALGAAAVAELSAGEADLVAAHLSTTDSRLVLGSIAPVLAEGDADDAAALVLAAHRRLGRPPVRDDQDRWALRTVIEVLRGTARRAPRDVIEMTRAVARLARVAASGDARVRVVHRLLEQGNASGLRLVLGAGDAEALAPLARVQRPLVKALVEALTESPTKPPAPSDTDVDRSDWMPIAAPLLFAPIVAALPLDHATRGWPVVGESTDPPAHRASAAALARLCIMAVACGGERAARVLADPTTRLLAGVGVAVTATQIRAWLAMLGVSHAARLEWTLGEWSISSGMVGLEPWLLTSPPGDDESSGGAYGMVVRAESRIVLLDPTRGHWLAVRDEGAGALPSLRHWVSRPSATVQSPAELAAAGGDSATATLARLDRMGAELHWLRLPESIGVPRPIELALTVAAQGVLRTLAWRLPGFSRASLPHLWTNFLAIDAQVQQEPHRISAALGRPPLAMVMSMTGMLRTSYRLPWCGERVVALFPAESG